jgi:hypothetical protein
VFACDDGVGHFRGRALEAAREQGLDERELDYLTRRR